MHLLGSATWPKIGSWTATSPMGVENDRSGCSGDSMLDLPGEEGASPEWEHSETRFDKRTRRRWPVFASLFG